MELPKYLGSVPFIHANLQLPGYFTTTAVADWDLTAYVLSGEGVESFVSALERINDIKTVDRDIRKHAWSLLKFFSIEQHVTIATNQVEEARNRLTLQGYEHREVQEDLRSTFEEHLANRRRGTQAQPCLSLLASGTSSSTSSFIAGISTADIPHPALSRPTDNIHSSSSMKHPRDVFDDESAGLPKTPRNKSPSPITVSVGASMKNPLQDNESDDEDEEGSDDEADEENDVFLPDATEQEFRFYAVRASSKW